MNCPTCNKYNNPDITYDRVRYAIGDKAIVKLTIAGKESVFDLTGTIASLVYDEIEKELSTQPTAIKKIGENYE